MMSDFDERERIVGEVHNELKERTIEILTDQLMLKDKEIQTLKKQLNLMIQ